MPVITRGDLGVPTTPQFSKHIPTISTRMGRTSAFVTVEALTETPKVIWADRYPHPMECDPRPDTEPLPSDPEEFKWDQDDERRFNHCVVHCTHIHCRQMVHRCNYRAHMYGTLALVSCSCSGSDKAESDKMDQPSNRAEELTLDTYVTADEISALANLDVNAEITIHYADANQFHDALHAHRVFDEIELRDSDDFKRYLPPPNPLARIAEVAGIKLHHEVGWYFEATVQETPTQSRSISPANLKKEITTVLGIAIMEWLKGDWSHERRKPFHWVPDICKYVVEREPVVRAVWQRWDKFVDEFIKLFVLRHIRTTKEELANRASHINSHPSDGPSGYIPRKDVQPKADVKMQASHIEGRSSDGPSGDEVSGSLVPKLQAIRIQPDRAAKKRKRVPDQDPQQAVIDGNNKRQKRDAESVKAASTRSRRNVKKPGTRLRAQK